ncbi:MAG: 50S ribosomal protein L6 [Candidatus Wolfebacteria bacterium]|nr:50S ribosomal protein L6 [Candidatus Wolfebacteria bacterium]
MSKIGKKPIVIPDGTEIKIDGREIEVKGKSGALVLPIPSFIKAEIKDKELIFSPENNSKQARANWGTIRSLTNNAVIGVMKGFQKTLEIEGVGYRAVMEGDTLVLSLGYSHPVKFIAPEGVKVSVAKNTINIAGINKDAVGKAAAKIRAFKKVEPYKGKGIKYQGEIVRRKVGKKVAGATK